LKKTIHSSTKSKERGFASNGKPSFAFKGANMSKKPKSNNNARQNPRQQNQLQQQQQQKNNHFELRQIKPLTVNQQRTFESYKQGFNLMLHGYAGTGKTFCALYLALNELLTGDSEYDKIIVIRSVVPSRDMGFLPGSIKDKTKVYEEPYKEIADDLFGRGDGYDILKMKNLIYFTTTSFLRGMTFNKAIVIVDETNNMTFQEIDTVMTRMGNKSRVIFCGDYRQSDLNKPNEKEGITQFMRITNKIHSFRHVEFEKEDIVRSGIVKDYIINKTELGM
jgi:phosphate starvation-inducible protein PhoH